MTNNKPLGEWTLNEVKAECDGRGCIGCPFSKTFRSYEDEWENVCVIQEPPLSWDLPESPRFTPDEEAALRVLKAAGIEKVVREAYDDDNRSMSASKLDIALYAKLKDAGSYYIPAKMFPSIKPGQSVEL